MYPEDILKNKKHRLNVLSKASDNPELQAYLMEKCRKNMLYWLGTFGWTYNPRLDEPNLPFIPYEFQKKYISQLVWFINNGTDSSTEKSRDMGFSWCVVALHVWGFLFHGWSSLYGSYKEAYVDKQGDMDSFFERCRYMINRLPVWMKPPDMIDKFMSISSKTLNADIAGDCGQNFGTGGRRKFVTLDEFALWQHDGMAFRKTKDVTNCRIFGGTPEGRFNIYGKIMTNHKDYQGLEIEKIRLHWRLHPLKDEQWYEDQKKQRTKLDIAKELDISYDDSVTGAVYKDFTQVCTFGRYEFNPALKLYTGWDFGRDMTAIIWFQKDFTNDRIHIIDTYQKEDKDIDFFVAFIRGEPTEGFTYSSEELDIISKHANWKHAYAGHYGDPYNADNRSVVTQNTIKTVLAEHGIHIITKRGSTVAERINKTTLAMRRINIDDRLHDFIQAIGQSRYPQVKENSQATNEKLKPIHDINSHYRTALEYMIDNEPKGVESNDINLLYEYYG